MSRAEVEAASDRDRARAASRCASPSPGSTRCSRLTLAVVAPLVALRFRVARGLRGRCRRDRDLPARRPTRVQRGTILTIVPVLAGALVGLVGDDARLTPAGVAGDQAACWIGSRPRAATSARAAPRALLLLVAAFGVDHGHARRRRPATCCAAPTSPTVDYRFSVRGEQPPSDDVVVVGIDDKTQNADPPPTYPLGRDCYARTIRNLTARRRGGDRRRRRVHRARPGREGGRAVDRGHSRRRSRDPVSDRDRLRAAPPRCSRSARDSAYAGGVPAITLVFKDSDGHVRRMLFSKQKLPSFAVAAAEARLGERIDTAAGPLGLDRLRGTGAHDPVPELCRRRAQ